MPITNTKIEAFTKHNGGNRATAIFTFADGRVVGKRIRNAGDDETAALAIATGLVPNVESSFQSNDANEAIGLGLFTAHKEASEAQVKYEWLLQGYNKESHYEAYMQLKDLAPAMLAMGLTDAQYAATFNTTVEEVSNIKDYWEFLDTNKVVIQAYNAIGDVRENH